MKKNSRGLLLFMYFLVLGTACGTRSKGPAPVRFYRVTEPVYADSAMVVSAKALASQTGIDIMRAGGNAVDAAVAVAFALAVVYPSAGNIGGGGFMVLRLADGSRFTLDFREKAPEAADRDMYLNSLGHVIPGASWEGHLATGVPGTVDGLWRAHQRYGRLPWKKLLRPAIRLAAEGYLLSEVEARKLNNYRDQFLALNTKVPVNYVRDEPWQAGDTLKNPDLAHTLELIADLGRNGFYRGETAEKIVAEMQRGGGLITASDLEKYRAIWRAPVIGHFRGYTVVSMGPPSSGGILLVQLLTILENYPLEDWGWNSARTVHLMTEAERRVYADRSRYLGDEDFFPVPVSVLTNRNYLVGHMENFNPDHATPSDSVRPGNIELLESEETTHFSIVDPEGNAVAVTTTLNGSFGCKVVVGGAGFFLNNEMDDFSVKPGVPNAYGLTGSEANAIAPGKRMLSSMTPTIVERNGRLFMVIGTPGGSTIITSVLQAILNVTVYDMNMQEAVSALKVHHQWRPDTLFMEAGALTLADSLALVSKGHILQVRSPIGRLDGIRVLEDGRLESGVDPRGEDAAIGF